MRICDEHTDTDTYRCFQENSHAYIYAHMYAGVFFQNIAVSSVSVFPSSPSCPEGKAQLIDEDALSLGVGIKRNLIVVLAQTEAAQCPRHQVVLGMKPAEGASCQIGFCRPEGLHDSHLLF